MDRSLQRGIIATESLELLNQHAPGLAPELLVGACDTLASPAGQQEPARGRVGSAGDLVAGEQVAQQVRTGDGDDRQLAHTYLEDGAVLGGPADERLVRCRLVHLQQVADHRQTPRT